MCLVLVLEDRPTQFRADTLFRDTGMLMSITWNLSAPYKYKCLNARHKSDMGLMLIAKACLLLSGFGVPTFDCVSNWMYKSY